MAKKRVAIIGAGCSGLTSIKACLDEDILPVCYEMSSDIGGLWNYTDDLPNRLDRRGASVYRSCSINTSKEMMAFSDLPMPVDFPPFMPHYKVLDYFQLYATTFNLRPHIKFTSKVVAITRTMDHQLTGRWDVKVADLVSEVESVDTFDGVMICSGHHRFPHTPNIDGLSRFKGQVIHTSDYKTRDTLTDRKVLVIGIGNSGADVATDASLVARQVDVSTRRGSWIFSRFFPGGLPADFLANTRFMMGLPKNLLQWMVELMANFKYNGENYGLLAGHRGLEAHPTIHDYLTIRIMSGYIKMRPAITHLMEDGAVFDNGHFEEFDTVILATGYDYKFPFLPEEVFVDGEVNCYKFTFLPHLERPESMCFIGLVQAIGAVMPIAELQARWFARVLAGKSKLPPVTNMLDFIDQRKRNVRSNYVTSRRHDSLETYWVEAMDSIASEIGAKPNLLNLLATDPALAVRCYFGPCVPAQYRLFGPNSKPALAKRMIGSCFTNVTRSTQTRKPIPPSPSKDTMTSGWSHRIMSIKVLLYTLFFVFVAFVLAHAHLI